MTLTIKILGQNIEHLNFNLLIHSLLKVNKTYERFNSYMYIILNKFVASNDFTGKKSNIEESVEDIRD